MKLESNVCGVERAIRLILGVTFVGLAFFEVFTGISAILVYIIGTVALVTGLFKFCPLTTLVGVNTCNK